MKNLLPWRKRNKGELAASGDILFPLSRMRDEFDRMLARMAPEFSLATFSGGEWPWGIDVDDREDKVIVKAEAPGFEPGDFDIRVEDGQLVLNASKKIETKDEKGKVTGYREQSCYESLTMPTAIDQEKILAEYRNGILTVTLPRTADAKTKRIAVKGS